MPKKTVNLILLTLFCTFALLFLDFSILKLNIGQINDSFYLGFWSGRVALFSTIIVLILAVALLARSKSLPALPKILISVGVATNLIERVILGGVLDYIPFFHLTVFNISDILITAGFMLVLIELWGQEKRKK